MIKKQAGSLEHSGVTLKFTDDFLKKMQIAQFTVSELMHVKTVLLRKRKTQVKNARK